MVAHRGLDLNTGYNDGKLSAFTAELSGYPLSACREKLTWFG